MKITSTNPSKNYEVVGEVEASTEADISQAVKAARKAQLAWAQLSLQDRCVAFTSFIQQAEGASEELAQIIATETGRPITSARGDVADGLDDMKAYVEMADAALSPQVTHETETTIHRVYREPRGVIAAICPWNFPFSNVAWQCGQALIAGNAIVYKNSEENPLFARKLAELFAASDIPSGVFSVVYGDGTVGESLARAGVDMISFTGSLQVGRKLTVIGAEQFIPVVTELGGSSPCIVFDDVELTDDVIAFIYGRRFSHSGQFCTSVKRLLVHESKFDELIAKLSALIATKKIGDALDETTNVGPLVAERQVIRLAEQVADAVEKGATVVCGGNRPAGLQGAYFEPTIVTSVKKDMRVWHEETFGPVLAVVGFTSEDEAVALANDTIYGLGAHILTGDSGRFNRLAPQIQSGMVAENLVSYFHPKNPFGGYKQSGMGRENGFEGFHEVTQIKLISQAK